MPAKSKSQQQFMGMVHACQKYGKCASAEVRKTAKSIKPGDAEDFASTKHKGLPERKGKKMAEENKNEYAAALGALARAAGPKIAQVAGKYGPQLAQTAAGSAGTAVGEKIGAKITGETGERYMHKGVPHKKKKKKKMKEHTTFEEYAQWRDSQLNEVGTTTADVAQFRRMTIPATVRRQWPDSTDEFFKTKKSSSTGCSCVDKE